MNAPCEGIGMKHVLPGAIIDELAIFSLGDAHAIDKIAMLPGRRHAHKHCKAFHWSFLSVFSNIREPSIRLKR